MLYINFLGKCQMAVKIKVLPIILATNVVKRPIIFENSRSLIAVNMLVVSLYVVRSLKFISQS